jgi:alanine dehydrogenase
VTLVLSEQDVAALLEPAAVVQALEGAFRELGEGTAVSRPRTDTSVVHPAGDRSYRFKTMDGVLPGAGVAVVRINSDSVQFKTVGGERRYGKVAAATGAHVSFNMLFDVATGEPLAILPDRNLQRARVAGTSALAARYLARPESRRLAIVGSGWQADAMVHALKAVLPITEGAVYSPTPAHRAAFAERLSREAGMAMEPSGSMAEAVRGADVVAVCTNSLDAFFGWNLVEPGMHLTTIRFPNMRTEVFHRADVVITNQRPSEYVRRDGSGYVYLQDYVGKGVQATQYSEDARLDPASPEHLEFRDYGSLEDLVVGLIPGRTAPEQVTFHVNNIGLGVQFAAVGKLLYEGARAQGRGTEIPTEIFLSYQPAMSI